MPFVYVDINERRFVSRQIEEGLALLRKIVVEGRNDEIAAAKSKLLAMVEQAEQCLAMVEAIMDRASRLAMIEEAKGHLAKLEAEHAAAESTLAPGVQ